MRTSEINKVLKNNPYSRRYFIGTFAANQCPKTPTPNTCFISNTDPHYLPGQHWIAMYVKNDGNIYYFDPYGIRPITIYHTDFLKKSSDGSGTYNRKQVQQLQSTTCGIHCINFIIESCRLQDPNQTMVNLITLPTPFVDRMAQQNPHRLTQSQST